MPAPLSLLDTIRQLTDDTVAHRQTLEGALFALQTWVDQRAEFMTEQEREAFSQTLNAEKSAPEQEGQPRGDDSSLVSSVLRLHAMRLLYRYDEAHQPPEVPDPDKDNPYHRATRRLQLALRETEIAINEARVDTVIANAQHMLDDTGANRRWLQDAFVRLQTVAQKDLIKLAEAVPMPELPPLNILQRVIFGVMGIKQQEIARRNLASIRQLAELQTSQLVEMVKLLADSFNSIGDSLGAKQALALLARFADK